MFCFSSLDNLIGRFNSMDIKTNEWFLEAKWNYDQVSNDNLFLLCYFKIGSTDVIYSNKLRLILDSSRLQIEKGDLEVLSGAGHDSSSLTDEQRSRLKELAEQIPSAKRSGPEISLQRMTSAKVSKHECEGESSIRMACGNTNTVVSYQNMMGSEEKLFRQDFTITHIIFSKKPTVLPEILQQKRSTPVEKPISVTHLTVVYQTHDGGWKECDDVMIAPVAVRNEEPRWLTDSVIHVEPDKLFSFTVRGSLIVKGDVGRDNSTRQRIHKNLPQPFKLKLIATDNFGKQCSLVVEQVNKPLQLDSRERFVKNNQSSIKEMLTFLYADDCELEERIFLAIYINKDQELVVRNSNSFSCVLNLSSLRTYEYNARQNQSTELLLDQIHYQSYTNECKAFLLFDSLTKIFYGVRGELTTQTSRAEETVFVSRDKLLGA